MAGTRHARRRLAAMLSALVAAGALVSVASPTRVAAADPGIHPRADVGTLLSHEVYGYLPYWRLNAATAGQLDYDLLSTIAFFGLGIKATGDLDMAWRGSVAYMSADAVAVTNAAHAKGVRVVPTFQLFDSGNLTKMKAFLGSLSAQNRFIGQALDLMARRSADGANFDFEPMPASLTPQYLSFLARFNTAMDARFPKATLVNASSAGAPPSLITGLVPIVDRQFVMTYNYRWTGSTVTGSIAPLDHAARNVKIHMKRFMAYAPKASLILGVPYYGYDWPVTSTSANATVRADKSKYGAVKSVTYASARDFLAAHPEVVRLYDEPEGSSYYTYWDTSHATYRQVYFEDERSAAAKYEYTITTGFAGVGIWTLGNDAGYGEMWDALSVFFAPDHEVTIAASIRSLARLSGIIHASLEYSLRNAGEVPERGAIRWRIRNDDGRQVAHGTLMTATLGIGRTRAGTVRIRLGSAAELSSGTWTVEVLFVTPTDAFTSPRSSFRQPF
jgi:glycosyl hydrolase family 18 (putative chitinase)